MPVTPTKPGGKERAVSSMSTGSPGATNDDVIPVLLAANPGITLNYKQMMALDPQHRTYSSWEHKFRKWRAKAKDIANGTAKANGESSKDTNDTGGNTNSEPATAVEPKTPSSLEVHGSNDGDDVPTQKSNVAKKVTPKEVVETDIAVKKNATPEVKIGDDNAGDKQAVPIRSTTPKKRPTKTPATGDDSSVKIGEDKGSPLKKARGEKKGIARVVKKPAKKPTEIRIEISDDEDSDGVFIV